jgi:hypothetical protein
MTGRTGSVSPLPARAPCPARAHLADDWLQSASGQLSLYLDPSNETNALNGGK